MSANSYTAKLAADLERFADDGVRPDEWLLREWATKLRSLGEPHYRWVPVTERLPLVGGWYGVLDAQDEKRAAMFHVRSQSWIHSVVPPIKAWCEFPPYATERSST